MSHIECVSSVGGLNSRSQNSCKCDFTTQSDAEWLESSDGEISISWRACWETAVWKQPFCQIYWKNQSTRQETRKSDSTSLSQPNRLSARQFSIIFNRKSGPFHHSSVDKFELFPIVTNILVVYTIQILSVHGFGEIIARVSIHINVFCVIHPWPTCRCDRYRSKTCNFTIFQFYDLLLAQNRGMNFYLSSSGIYEDTVQANQITAHVK